MATPGKDATPLLRLDGVSKWFETPRPLEVLRAVSLQVKDGEFVSIVGPSGCGKSTLFNLIVGVESLTAGAIELAGETDPVKRRLLAAYMFQKDLLLPWRDVVANAVLGLEVSRACPRTEARARAMALLPRFGLEGFERHHPAELSGGMRQRVALLRTLLLERPMLLLDEPFASLDALTRLDLQDWLRDTWHNVSLTGTGRGRGALLVTHDVREAARLSDRIYVMSARPGRILTEIAVSGSRDAQSLLAVEQEVLATLGAAEVS